MIELQHDGQADRTPQPLVGEQADECGLTGRARGDRVEQLREHEDREAHRAGLGHLEFVASADRAIGEQAAFQVHVHADQRDGGHDDADEGDVDPHVPVDHAIGELARLTGHHVVGLRVDAHRERGGRVGEQVDPQQLRGEQRHGDAFGAG